MPSDECKIDAELFRLIHRLATSTQKAVAGRERRGSQREPFHSVQRIAPRRRSELPDESEFFEVRCHDLTPNGFSFFVPRRPNFTSLVISFGAASERILVGAEVLHCDKVLLYSSGRVKRVRGQAGHLDSHGPNGDAATLMVLVGCRFTKRLQ